jgi:hypothetical protein
MGPDLGIIEDVDVVILSFPGSHDLYAECPDGEVATFDRVPHVFGVIVGLFASKPLGVLLGHGLDALVGNDVEFDVDKASILLVS